MDVKSSAFVHPVVATFTKLETVLARREAIESLVAILTHHEIRELQTWTSKQEFRHDIIGNLPIEIVVAIFSYVDLSTAFRSRRVSQKWATILSSLDFTQQILLPWLSRGDPGLGLREGLPSSMAATIMAEHIDAFRSGRPFNVMTLCLKGHQPELAKSLVVYCQGFLSLPDIDPGIVQLLCFRENTIKHWAIPNRETPFHLGLSERLIAVYTLSGKVNIYNHRTKQDFSFRLSSVDVTSFIVKGGTLAILHGAHVTTWSIESGQTRQIRICPDISCLHFVPSQGIYIVSSEKDIIYYELCSEEDGNQLKVSFTRMGLDGSIGFKDLKIRIPRNAEAVSLPMASDPAIGKSLQKMLAAIEYEKLRHVVEFRRFCGCPEITAVQECYWKDICYKTHFVPHTGKLGLTVRDIGYSTAVKAAILTKDGSKTKYAECGRVSVQVPSFISHLDGNSTLFRLFGDESFLVHNLYDRIAVYCFHKDVHMFYPGAECKRLRP